MNRRSMLKTALAALAVKGSHAFDTAVANAGMRSGAGESIPSWTKPTYAERRPGQPLVPEGMVYIPAGSFVMGAPAAEISRPHARGEGGPPGAGSRGDTRHNVRLSAFCISKYQITNAQYKRFCDSAGPQNRPGGRRSGAGCYWDHPMFDWTRKANHPVLFVGYNQATAYCKWVSHTTGWDVMLPSEAQWERAARGVTRTGFEFDFPWGDETSADDYQKRLTFNVTCAMDNGINKTVNGILYPHWPFVVETRGSARMASNFKCVVYAEEDERTRDIAESSEEVKAVWKRIMDAGGHTTPVGTYPAGPEGCFDMAGNAFEWTRDFYTISSYNALADKEVDPCIDDASMLTEDDKKSGSDGTMGGGPESSNGRPTKIIRGGSWYANEGSCRTHRRTETRAAGQGGFHSVGFRIVTALNT